MCGIAGVVDFRAAPDAGAGERGAAALGHRGPDTRGAWSEGPVALGHARLSILDLSPAGGQPMTSACGRYTIVYNGEVYNFPALRAELEAAGSRLTSHSDTEVVLEALARWGEPVLPRLNGIFALALWDRVTQRLTLARDRFGVKPLHYHLQGERLTFGSEIKAIIAVGVPAQMIDRQGLHEFLHYGAGGLGPRTLFAGIRKLEAATVLTFDARGVSSRRYWVPAESSPAGDTGGAPATQVCALLEDAVRRQLVSDVPVAVFLSGGIDSSAITAFASRHYAGRLTTYSVGFDFAAYASELPKAARVAAHFKTDHRELFIRGTDLPSVVEALIRAHDSPFADAANIPLFLLCRELHGHAKVVLQGDGGDEVFGGYSRYAWLRRARAFRALAGAGRAILPLLPVGRLRRSRLDRMVEIWSETDEAVRMALLLAQDSRRPSPARLLGATWRGAVEATDPFARYREMGQRHGALEPVQRMLWTDLQILLPDVFLEKVDRATMAQGVEARVPFLDHALVDYALALPAAIKLPHGEAKGLLKQALRGTVPDYVLDAPKAGFGVPYGRWLAGPLADFALERLVGGDAVRAGLIDGPAAAAALHAHRTGAADHGFLLWKMLNLALWFDRYRSHLVL
ncbi:asparagine synthase (glutamine-hydrolyzing) [Horticoccus sp. 23ND18S-11]|uniref:asparagine synthase (glutamine-hydrolyzing) n=1 Tax=Horticoccus sp. 23ND18S-11 TaxID=3391832 RepID=UPI0039C8E9F9